MLALDEAGWLHVVVVRTVGSFMKENQVRCTHVAHPRSAPPYRSARFSKKWKKHVSSGSIERTCTDVMDDSRSDGTASFVSERLATPDLECCNNEESLVDSSSKEAENMRDDETKMGTLEHDLGSDVVGAATPTAHAAANVTQEAPEAGSAKSKDEEEARREAWLLQKARGLANQAGISLKEADDLILQGVDHQKTDSGGRALSIDHSSRLLGDCKGDRTPTPTPSEEQNIVGYSNMGRHSKWESQNNTHG